MAVAFVGRNKWLRWVELLPVALPSRVSGVGATLPVPRPPERQVSREDVPPIQYEVLDRSPLTPAGAGR